MSNKVLILLDADVIIHLYKAEKLSLLNELYKGRLRVLDVVLTELNNNPTINKSFSTYFSLLQLEEIIFPLSLLQEYINLKKNIKGTGESACLIFCKHNNHIIASSNTTDILPYCKEHSIAFLTTLDILTIAVKKGKMAMLEANELIKKITHKDESRVCCKTLEEHIKKHFDNNKLQY